MVLEDDRGRTKDDADEVYKKAEQDLEISVYKDPNDPNLIKIIGKEDVLKKIFRHLYNELNDEQQADERFEERWKEISDKKMLRPGGGAYGVKLAHKVVELPSMDILAVNSRDIPYDILQMKMAVRNSILNTAERINSDSQVVDQWEWDHDAELRKAKVENHFSPIDSTVFISGDEGRSSLEYHMDRCAALIYFCEAFDIKIAGLGIHGSRPVVYVDVRPSVPTGYPKKYGTIMESKRYPKEGRREITMEPDFDISVFGVAVKEKKNGSKIVDLDKVPII